MTEPGPAVVAHNLHEGIRPTALAACRTADLVVLDNFWADAESLRTQALAASYTRCHSESGFSFRMAHPSHRQVVRALDLIARVVGRAVVRAYHESRFVAETEDDERLTRQRTWVHFDEWSWVGVLYLSAGEGARGGTSFFRHRPSGLTSIKQARSKGERDALFADSTREEAWDLIHEVRLRFNRLVLFRPQFFHQASCYFGRELSECRLYQLFAFNSS